MRSSTAVWLRKRKGKRGATYGLRWIDPRTGDGRSESCGHDLALARLRRDAVRAELREGLSGRLAETTVPKLAEKLVSMMAGKAPVTIVRTKESLMKLGALCNPRRIEDIDRGTIMEFKSKRLADKVSLAMVNKQVREIRSALSYAVDAGLLRVNPLLRWKGLLLRGPQKAVRVIEEAEFASVLQRCVIPGFKALLTVGYRQGLRRTELTNLRWAAVDLERGTVAVVNRPKDGELTKSRKNRTLPLHPEVRELLGKMYAKAPKIVGGGRAVPKVEHVFGWPDGKPFKPDWVTRAFVRLATEAGIPHATLHDLRRSFSTLAQRAGVDKEMVKDLGGWSAVSVVERHYTGEVGEAMQAAMRKIAAAG